MADLKRNLICLRFRSDFFFYENQFQIFIFLLWGEKAYIDKRTILRYNSVKSYKKIHEDINFFGETPSWARKSLQK